MAVLAPMISWQSQPEPELMECKSDDECLYFTFYKDDSLCVGFANCVEFQEDSCTNCNSGESACEGTQKVHASFKCDSLDTF